MTKGIEMALPIYQVDAFTLEPFGGNPAGVCMLAESPSDAGVQNRWMQNVAMEMNLSETAFVQRRADGSYDLRWFTPTVEVDLCGHATLASAHILWETGQLPREEMACFHTRSGLLTARIDTDGMIWLNFPAKPVEVATPPPGLLEAFGMTPHFVGRNNLDYLLELASEVEVRAQQPNFAQLRQLPARGVIVTARAESETLDFVSRFFAPAAGVDEDPVTGSAHCALGPFWQERLGKAELTGFQASRRGGVVRVVVAGERVHLGGYAVTTVRGELLPTP